MKQQCLSQGCYWSFVCWAATGRALGRLDQGKMVKWDTAQDMAWRMPWIVFLNLSELQICKSTPSALYLLLVWTGKKVVCALAASDKVRMHFGVRQGSPL